MSEKDRLAAGTAELLELNAKENSERKFQSSFLNQQRYSIFPGVFSPIYFPETAFFAANIPIEIDDLFWEVGCGAGIASVVAAKKGAQFIFSTDITLQAVENTAYNLENHSVPSTKRRTAMADVYTLIESRPDGISNVMAKGIKFNKIYWNVPWDPSPKEKYIGLLERSCYDPNHNATTRFIREAQNHLHHNGSILLGISPSISNADQIYKELRRAGFVYKVIAESKVELGKSEGVRVRKYKGSTDTLDLQLLEAN